MSKLNITERRNGDVLILDLEGNIILGEGSRELRQAIRDLLQLGERKILLNLEDVFYIDSSGLGELVASYMALQKNDGECRLVHLSPKVNELMVLTKLLTVFDVYDNESEAVESFNNPKVETALASIFV
jgi:anti-sigma B factor antagonist